MSEYRAYCEECGEEYMAEMEEGAVGWMVGHYFRTEHHDTKKEKL